MDETVENKPSDQLIDDPNEKDKLLDKQEQPQESSTKEDTPAEPAPSSSNVKDPSVKSQDINVSQDIVSVTAKEWTVSDEKEVDEFVIVDPRKHRHRIFEDYRPRIFAQVQALLQVQLDKFKHYQTLFENQENPTMATRFETYAAATLKHMEVLETSRKTKGWIPPFTYEVINFNATPFNPDVKERELQITVKTSHLSKDDYNYIVAEFEFAHPSDEPFFKTMSRWYHYSKIEPKNLCLCSTVKHRQYDKIPAIDAVPFDDLFTHDCLYKRPISFFVDKGKSRTLKRKFKPVKLTFYRRKGNLRYSTKIGSVQVKIDAINDEATLYTQIPLSNGRKVLDEMAEIRVKVREPLVDKTPRPHEEKILTFM